MSLTTPVALKDSKIIVLLQLIICVLGSWYLFGSNLKAKWNVIDDHEIFNLIGPFTHLPFDRIWHAFSTTEVVKFADYPRYRPSYYTLRILECILWGKNPFSWYLARLVMLVTALFLYWRVLQSYLGIFGAGLLLAYFLHYSFWSDLFSRLGPAETYCAFGLAIYIYGYFKILSYTNLETRNLELVNVALLTLGSLICVGTKENFIILLLSSWILLTIVLWKGVKSPALYVSVAIQTVYSAVIVTSVYLAILKIGSDVYANSVSVSDRTMILMNLLLQTRVQIWIYSAILLFIGALYLRRKDSMVKSELYRLFIKAFIAVICLLSVYSIQYVFYNGAWPNHTRYDFPGILIIPIYWSIVIWLFFKLIKFSTISNRVQSVLFSLSYLSMLLLISTTDGYKAHINTALGNVHNTQQFTKRIHRLHRLFLKSPSIPIVIVTANAIDYEAIFSYQRFLQNGGTKNPISIETRYQQIDSPDSLFGKLQAEMVQISRNGNENFMPLPTQAPKCFALVFSGSESSLGCKIV